MGDSVGIVPGDKLIKVGDIEVTGPRFAYDYRQRYARERPGLPMPIIVERNGQRLTLQGSLRMAVRVERHFGFLPNAGEKAARIRASLLRG
jgi:hypothetical protein